LKVTLVRGFALANGYVIAHSPHGGIVGVFVGVTVGVFVGVTVGVFVGVLVGVFVAGQARTLTEFVVLADTGELMPVSMPVAATLSW
jgi:hypothetical protein